MADTKISALPAASTPLTGSEVVPLNQSGVTSNVTVANLTAGRNITFNNTLPGYTTTATAAGTTTLTSSSTYHQRFTGSSAQTIVLPAATTMAQGQGFVIDNDSSGTLALQDGSAASLGSVTPGMAAYIFCENNSTTAGSWSGYMFVPGAGPGGQVTWGTTGLSMGGQAITNANWNATTIGTGYGGTGLTSFTVNGIVYASSTSALATSSGLVFDGTNFYVGTTTSGIGTSRATFYNNGSNVTAQFSAQSGTAASTPNIWMYHGAASGSTAAIQISFLNGSASQVGSITSTGSVTAYVTISDYRLKENVVPMIGALDTIAQLKPVTYKWKIDGSDGQGFIAHELQAVVPDCVTGEKDAVDAEGKPVYQGIDTSFLVATLTAAIQELSAQVTTLQTQVTALQAKVGV
jgi:hypothetical protein